MINNLSIFLAAIYLTLVAVVMFFANGGGLNIVWIIGALFFLAVATVPQIFLALLVREAQTNSVKGYFLTVQIIVSITALHIYYDAFFQNSDAQSGLLLIFIPIAQGSFAGVAFVLFKALQSFKKAKN